MTRGGNWLAAEGEYRDFVESLSVSDPRLRNRDPKAIAQKIPWEDRDVRVVTLELAKDDSFGRAVEIRDSASLSRHLGGGDRQPGARTVYVLEGLGPGFIAVLGRHFALHPSIFLEHERCIVMNRRSQGESDGMPLPSVLLTREHVEMKYFELLRLDRPPESFRLVCGRTGRHIGVARAESTFTDTGIVRRKCSLWSRTTAQGGWECETFRRAL